MTQASSTVPQEWLSDLIQADLNGKADHPQQHNNPSKEADIKMHVETFQVNAEKCEAPKLFDRRYEPSGSHKPQYHRFRGDDLSIVIGFGLAYFFDATQSLWSRLILDRTAGTIDTTLPSGWAVRSIKLDRVWERHMEFIAPGAEHGLIIKFSLNMIRRPQPGDKPTTLADIMASFKIESEDRRLRRENSISEAYNPEDSTNVETLSVYPYGARRQRDGLIGQLENGEGAYAWSYRPQAKPALGLFDPRNFTTGESLLASSTTKAVQLDSAMETLATTAEFLRQQYPVEFEENLFGHAEQPYCALDKEEAELFGIIRPMLVSTTYPNQEFPEFIDTMWKRTAAIGLMDQVDILKDAAKILIEDGHTFPKNAVNDYNHRLFARASEDGVAIFMVEDEMTTSYVIERDRVIVADLDEKTMAVERVIIDFAIRSHDITLIRPTTTKLQDDVQRISYGLNSIISFHDTSLEKPRKYTR